MKRYRVFIADAISPEGLAPLRDDDRFEVVERPGLKDDDLARAIEGMHAVIVRSSTRITRDALRYADTLEVIGRAGVGVDNIDVEAATERGVAVLNAPSGNTISAAELTFALILACVRRIPAADRSMKAGEWDRKSFTGTELYGKTLGLVGAGRIGGEVARRARAFGMRVCANDPYLTSERARALEIELATLDDVLKRADVLSLHVPLTESTAGLIGAAQLATMKKGAIVVNAARGGVIDEAALAASVQSGHLASAGLDVFAEEPAPADHPLRGIPQVVLTPHLGAATQEAQHNVAVEIAEAVRAALADGDLTRAVNAPAIGGEEMRRLRPMLELCDRIGALLIFDEIQVGLGRTGTLWAHEAAGVAPDIMTLAKPLAGGLPMGATLVNERVAGAIRPGDHATTFGGGPLVASAALAVCRKIGDPAFLAEVRRKAELVSDRLGALALRKDEVVAARGAGLIWGLQIERPAGEIVAAAMQAGLLLVGAGANVVRILPPLTISDEDLLRGLSILEECL